MLGIALPPLTPLQNAGPESWMPTLIVIGLAVIVAAAALVRVRMRHEATVHPIAPDHRLAA